MKSFILGLVAVFSFMMMACQQSADPVNGSVGAQSCSLKKRCVKLAWNPVTTDVNGQTLTEVPHYKILWGTTSGTYPNSQDTGTETIAAVANLPVGMIYFVAVAYLTSNGAQSTYSNEVSGTARNIISRSPEFSVEIK